VTPLVRSALLWGAVGLFAFLVLVQGYQLLVAPLPIGIGAGLGLAVLVGAVTALLSYVAESRLGRNRRT
jgi:hypothetical protein